MMFIDFLLQVFSDNRDKEAIIWRDQAFSYEWLSKRVRYWLNEIEKSEIESGHVVMIEADFSPESVAIFLALTELGGIVVPLTKSVEAKKDEFIETAMGQWLLQVDVDDNASCQRLSGNPEHKCYAQLRNQGNPGLVLFSSGTTGKSKAAVHDLAKLLEKFKTPRHALRGISFLLYDHIGGVNTLLYMLANGGCIVTLENRQPDYVLSAIERHSVELLPTSPTFINLILLSEAYRRYDISCLKTVTYGTEPMPESTLLRFNSLFPHIRLLQTYGLSELGILRSKSKESSSLWMKIGGEGFDTRIVDNMLEIKAHSAMLGYLNAPSPFTEDGWFITGDMVETDGEYIKVLGRKSEIINVGGQKVYPAEVESVLQTISGVAEAEVFGEPNALLGHVVCAKIRVADGIELDKKLLKRTIKRLCSEKLQSFQIPAKITFDQGEQFSARFKKQRNIG